MKFVTFRREPTSVPRLGVLRGDDVIDISLISQARGTESERFPESLKAYIERFGTDHTFTSELLNWFLEHKNAAIHTKAAYPVTSVHMLPPIPDPGKFFCVGKNNKEHLEELRRTKMLNEIPTEPTGFLKLNSVLVGNDASVARPLDIIEFDYEPEMAFVISRRGYRVSKDQAMSYVFGITMLNDLSAREVQKREVAMNTRFLTAKNMPGFGPVGPCVVTLDEIGDPNDLWLTCSVNGMPRMRVHTGGLIYKIPDILEHYSRFMPIERGDVFSTGSAGGVAVGQPNAADLYLKPGDLIEVACDRIGALRTHIVEPTEALRA